MMTAIGSLILLTACFPMTNDAVGLNALAPTIGALGQEVVRVDDDALTTAFRNHAATWQAAAGK